jgi:formate hydrogenlyase subunit 6/NADH:ubiquinone oxidoreductase subunit I
MLRDVLHSLFVKPVTEQYPAERRAVPAALRGKLRWDPRQCTGCALCVKDCPANAINLITIDKADKRFVMEYHADRCIYCGQCVQSCRFNCIELINGDWELAAPERENYTVFYGDPNDVEIALARQAQGCDQVVEEK